MGHRGMRVGEVSHPGPPLTIKTANVTNLMPHLPYVADFNCDVIALQEVRLTEDGQTLLKRICFNYFGPHFGVSSNR